MLIWVYFTLTCASVWGFPEKRIADKQNSLQPKIEPPLKQLSPQNVELKNVEFDKKPRLFQRKCMSGIAQKACAEAKAAQMAQNAAGAQAAHMVKTQLAEKALQAAKAAEAALAGKQAVVAQLQQEVKEAEAVVAENTAAVRQQQGSVNAACRMVQQATAMQKLVVQATQLACQLEKSAQCVLQKTKTGLKEKCHNLAEARARLAHLQHKLQCACADCAATKQAAHCACEAARAACGNARRRKRRAQLRALVSQGKIQRKR